MLRSNLGEDDGWLNKVEICLSFCYFYWNYSQYDEQRRRLQPPKKTPTLMFRTTLETPTLKTDRATVGAPTKWGGFLSILNLLLSMPKLFMRKIQHGGVTPVCCLKPPLLSETDWNFCDPINVSNRRLSSSLLSRSTAVVMLVFLGRGCWWILSWFSWFSEHFQVT